MMEQSKVVKMMEKALTPVTSRRRQFRFVAFRAVQTVSKRQELIVIRLPRPMASGKELWEQQKWIRDALMREECWELISFLGAIESVGWMSSHQISNTKTGEV
jgi:hypothetical protein